MIRSNVRVKPKRVVEEQPRTSMEDGALLAAALAATLVEYRTHVSQQRWHEGSAETATNWRTVACLERLRRGV